MWFQCLITVLRQFFKSICTTKQSDGKRICCALITDYYNPMNKHLSCQHLQNKLLPLDCDPICISPCAIFHVKKSSSCGFLIKCETLTRRPTRDRLCLSVLTRTFINIYESGWRLLLLVSQFGLFLHPFVPSSSTSHSLGQNAKNLICSLWHTKLVLKSRNICVILSCGYNFAILILASCHTL